VELLTQLMDVVLHLDQHLQALVASHGAWIYLILFLIVFCETGLVVTPFLPGDSLLFVAGTVAAAGGMDIHLLVLLLIIAAVLGDAVNYGVGHYIGPRIFSHSESRWLNPKHLQRAHDFYEKYGGKTIIIARFVPIVRTYAPFVAGAASMTYSRFALYNVSGAVLWVTSLGYAGYFFGNLPVIKNNLTLVIIGIIILSILPGVIEILRHRKAG
jgi:membrane-associated protein